MGVLYHLEVMLAVGESRFSRFKVVDVQYYILLSFHCIEERSSKETVSFNLVHSLTIIFIAQ